MLVYCGCACGRSLTTRPNTRKYTHTQTQTHKNPKKLQREREKTYRLPCYDPKQSTSNMQTHMVQYRKIGLINNNHDNGGKKCIIRREKVVRFHTAWGIWVYILKQQTTDGKNALSHIYLVFGIFVWHIHTRISAFTHIWSIYLTYHCSGNG